MQNQHFKAKNQQSSAGRRPDKLHSAGKSGIKEIICPETYSPIWQKAFALADNVRFTRTPDDELRRRRAALDPAYARIMAEAEAARAQPDAVGQSAEIAAKAERTAEAAPEIMADPAPEIMAESENSGRDSIEHMREQAEAAFAAPEPAAAVEAETKAEAETELPAQAETAAPEAQAGITEAETAAEPAAVEESAEAAAKIFEKPAETVPAVFPWDLAAHQDETPIMAAAAEYFRPAPIAPIARAMPAAEAAPAALAAPASPLAPAAPAPQINIERLFKTMECHQPQMRWIPVPANAPAAQAAPQMAAPQPAPAAAPAPQFAPSNPAPAAPAPQAVIASAVSAARAAEAAAETAAEAAKNLDVLCSSAVEKSGEAHRQAAPAWRKPAAAPQQAEAEAAAPAAETAALQESAPAAKQPQAAPAAAPAVNAKYSYQLPSLDFLQEPEYHDGNIVSQESLERSAGLLESILEDFGVKGEIIQVRPGPVVTLYEFEPAPGVKSSRVIGLADDIARSMSSVAARVAVIPGRNAIGIELPNKKREMVYLREILQSKAYKTSEFKLPLALGKNIGGEPVIAELAKMPHLLVAGTTGSGKSVAINTMILSLLYRMPPTKCRLIMVDPKMLELSVYDGIPHLLTPVVTDPKKAITALKWAVREMEDRYRKMAKLGVRNIDGFNARVKEALAKGEVIMCNVQAGFDKETGELLYVEEAMDLTPLPYIVIIVDEMADLMMVAGKEIEGAIQRLAQMARAAGIHLIMATQRPSVDVITGTIKANFPTRISFQVTSKIDSRTILGEQGAETLLGQGDMLQMAGGGRLNRIHGAFVSDREVERVVAYLKTQGTPEYLATVTESSEEEAEAEDSQTAVAEIVAAATAGGNDDFDDLYVQAVKVVMRDKKCSTSYIQRRLGIGYNKAASLVEKMEEEGLVGEANHVGKREILINS